MFITLIIAAVLAWLIWHNWSDEARFNVFLKEFERQETSYIVYLFNKWRKHRACKAWYYKPEKDIKRAMKEIRALRGDI